MIQSRTKATDLNDGGGVGGGALWLAKDLNGTDVGDLKQLMMVGLLWIDGKRCCSGAGVAFGRQTSMLAPSIATEPMPSTNDDLPNVNTSSVTLIWTIGTVTNAIL